MRAWLVLGLALWLVWLAPAADGAHNFAVDPGARTHAGTLREWPVPTPKYARDPCIAADGSVWFAVRQGARLARFDPVRGRFDEWPLPPDAQPQGVAVARDGKVLYGGTDIGELDPASGRLKIHRCPGHPCKPYSLALGDDDSVWFTDREFRRLGRLDRASGRFSFYSVGEDPYGVALDQRGRVWVTRKDADRVTRVDPATGEIAELALPPGSLPRRIALAPDGVLWVALYGAGRVVAIDPVRVAVAREYPLPGGPNGGPYAVNVDAAGRVWVSEIQTDTVIMLNPRSETMRAFRLPQRNAGVRSAAIDGAGRYWYLGSLSGRLGMVE